MSIQPKLLLLVAGAALAANTLTPAGSSPTFAAGHPETGVHAGPQIPTEVISDSDGTWDKGSEYGIVWSNYYHPFRVHGTTVVGIKTVRSPNVLPGEWSYATTDAMWWGTNHAFYRIF